MNIERLNRDRKALTGLFTRLHDLSKDEYNALIHAMWKLDRMILEQQD